MQRTDAEERLPVGIAVTFAKSSSLATADVCHSVDANQQIVIADESSRFGCAG